MSSGCVGLGIFWFSFKRHLDLILAGTSRQTTSTYQYLLGVLGQGKHLLGVRRRRMRRRVRRRREELLLCLQTRGQLPTHGVGAHLPRETQQSRNYHHLIQGAGAIKSHQGLLLHWLHVWEWN